MNTEELTELMYDRALAYRFLARAYRTAPDDALIQAMRETVAEAHDDKSLEALRVTLDASDVQQLRIDLAADYNQLFLGMSAKPVAPYESVYTSEEGLIMQEARDQVVQAYTAAGFKAPESFNLPEDHIALELEFVALLAEQTAAALDEGHTTRAAALVDEQCSFVRDHLASWVADFSSDVERRARTTFFPCIAHMTADQVRGDQDLLAEVGEAGVFAA